MKHTLCVERLVVALWIWKIQVIHHFESAQVQYAREFQNCTQFQQIKQTTIFISILLEDGLLQLILWFALFSMSSCFPSMWSLMFLSRSSVTVTSREDHTTTSTCIMKFKKQTPNKSSNFYTPCNSSTEASAVITRRRVRACCKNFQETSRDRNFCSWRHGHFWKLELI